MTSYYVPTKENLAKQTFLPPETVKDSIFDAWLKARGYDFVDKFNTAFRAGAGTCTYVYSDGALTELDGQQNVQLTYLRNTLINDYGYTVGDIERPPAASEGWQITITLY